MTNPADRGSRLARAGLAAAVLSRLFGRVVGILLVVLIAREADTHTVAVYGYLLGTATLVGSLTDLGVAAVAGREVAAGRLPAGGALWAAIPVQAASVAFAAAATVVLTVTLGPSEVPTSSLLLTLAFVVVTGFVGLWGEVLRGAGRVYVEGALQMASALSLVVGGVAVVEAGGGATALLVVVAVKEVAVLAVSMALLPARRDRTVRSRSLLGQSLWIAISGTVLVLLWRQGTIVAGTGSVTVLAVYVVASRYLDALVTVAHTAGIGLVPGVSALSTDPAQLRETMRGYLRMAFLVGLVVSVAGFLLARPLTVLPFGERWEDAVPAVRAICLSTLPVLVAFVAWPALLARHQVKLAAAVCGAAGVVSIVVSVALFETSESALAPAVGTLAGAVVLAGGMLWGVRDLLVGVPLPAVPPSPDEVADDLHVIEEAAPPVS